MALKQKKKTGGTGWSCDEKEKFKEAGRVSQKGRDVQSGEGQQKNWGEQLNKGQDFDNSGPMLN